MPRKPRLEFAGAVYHVMSRGDRREAIFSDERDCGRFLDTLEETKAHNDAAAALLDRGLQALELKREDLGRIAKLDPRKQVLDWWVRRRTAVRNRWICAELNLGDEGNVSRHPRRWRKPRSERLGA